MSVRDQLNSYLQRLEKRLRLGALIRGAAVLTSVALFTTVVLVLITNAFAFSRWSITSARVALLFALVLAITFGIALPVAALNRRRAARQAETVFPEFQQRLVTFAERDAQAREPFLDLLAADTLDVARGAEPARMVPDRKLAAFLGVGGAALCVLVWMILAGPGYLGHGAALLWAATPRDGAAPFYDLQVIPGDITVRRNSDQVVTAQLIGLQSSDVRLYARYQSASKWDQVAMRPQAGASGYQFIFAGLPESVEYYVEAGPLRSKHFNIRVLDLPGVKNVRVTYHYPSWTHLQDVAEERGGDLRAVEGTEANLEIETDKPLSDGVLVVDTGADSASSANSGAADDQKQIRLSGGGGNVYKGTIRMEKDGVYHVAILDQGQPVRLSNDFFIEARKAEPPNVIIARPGHDYRASPIEEVTVAVKADDEFGLSEMTLHYSVNGEAEKTIDLLKQKGVKQADGSTTISLEDFKLVPGDVVSLYAIAKDARAESRTDISFIQADPFEREFSQSQAGGGGGGGGGGQQDQNDISQREEEIIAETWKHRGDKTATAQAAAEAAKFLSGVQSKLGDQAKSLAGRMQSRELSQQNEEFGSFVKNMNAAADAMGPAAEKLRQQKWQDALPDEQKALQHLLRAEATFRQIQVAFGNGGGGGGAGGGAGRDLASLFDLELDTEKNQYETAQTAGSQSQQEKDIDEALQKLDQLARRQEELAQQQHNAAQSSEQRWQQEMLRRQAEELQRQMEQMARNNSQSGSQSQQSSSQGSSSSNSSGQSGSGQSGADGKSGSGDPRVQQSLDRLRQATDDMRRATSPQQSEAEARRAADRLKEATDLLGGMRQQQSSSKVDALSQEASRLKNEESSQSDRIRQMFANGGGFQTNAQDRKKLADDRQQLAEDMGKLEKGLQDTARELAGNKQTAASTKLRDALSDMQQSDLRARIQRGSDWMRRGIDPNANGMEPEIQAGMQRLEKGLQDAQQAMGAAPQPGNDSQQQGLETALNRVERLRNQMGGLSRDGQGRQQGQGQQANGQGGGQQGGQQGGQGGQQGGQQNGQMGGGPGGGPGARIGGGNNYGYGYRTNPGGGAYGDLYGNYDTGNNTPRGGAPVQPDNSPIPTQRSYDDSMRDLNQLRQAVQQDPEMEKQVQELIREMERLDPARFPGNPALVEQLHSQVLADVDKLELQLRRQLDDKQSGQVRSGDTKNVPQGYEEPVAEYYRRLSKTK
ncbi:MAG: DUF4175 domain-containing protein [Acidobacteriia bacterium]|nr:DUF4175 domain-containing protein [Terriglobia bacterium]